MNTSISEPNTAEICTADLIEEGPYMPPTEQDSIAATLHRACPRALEGTTYIYDFSPVTREHGPTIVLSPALNGYVAVVLYRGEMMGGCSSTGCDRLVILRCVLQTLKEHFQKSQKYQKSALFMLDFDYATLDECCRATKDHEPASDEERVRWIRRDTNMLWHLDRELSLLNEKTCELKQDGEAKLWTSAF